MAFAISVYRRSDKPIVQAPPDVRSPEFDEWLAEIDQRCLYSEPLGADGTIHQYWSSRAAELDLPMLTRIYDEGLVAEGDDLMRLRGEIDRLEDDWRVSLVEPRGTEPTLDQLSERAEYVRAAIRVAITFDGYLVIS